MQFVARNFYHENPPVIVSFFLLLSFIVHCFNKQWNCDLILKLIIHYLKMFDISSD